MSRTDSGDVPNNDVKLALLADQVHRLTEAVELLTTDINAIKGYAKFGQGAFWAVCFFISLCVYGAKEAIFKLLGVK
jgi:hypothetical protein